MKVCGNFEVMLIEELPENMVRIYTINTVDIAEPKMPFMEDVMKHYNFYIVRASDVIDYEKESEEV